MPKTFVLPGLFAASESIPAPLSAKTSPIWRCFFKRGRFTPIVKSDPYTYLLQTLGISYAAQCDTYGSYFVSPVGIELTQTRGFFKSPWQLQLPQDLLEKLINAFNHFFAPSITLSILTDQVWQLDLETPLALQGRSIFEITQHALAKPHDFGPDHQQWMAMSAEIEMWLHQFFVSLNDVTVSPIHGLWLWPANLLLTQNATGAEPDAVMSSSLPRTQNGATGAEPKVSTLPSSRGLTAGSRAEGVTDAMADTRQLPTRVLYTNDVFIQQTLHSVVEITSCPTQAEVVFDTSLQIALDTGGYDAWQQRLTAITEQWLLPAYKQLPRRKQPTLLITDGMTKALSIQRRWLGFF